ncbi:hypothetical protein CVT24_005616 [Panaeolus cyanescens]|uniref:PPPDE domain-containing protein n=1 Tax=Panaeolus cyanescens TaxID=181874 RepID=A0A409YY25_9AGAR|nr:hypothetical protein CVT24_005616 [Panaeolus cyanescens]
MATTVPVTQLHEYFDKFSLFDRCDVISVTHSKNLRSVVLHEYLHVIIRDKRNNHWLRLLVERQTNQDQVIIGIWPWVDPETGPLSLVVNSKAPLPLLMRNLFFQGTPLSLRTVADVLLNVHDKGPEYHFLSTNCFWHSDAVFKILSAAPGAPKLTTYGWLVLRGIPVIPSIIGSVSAFIAAEGFQRTMKDKPLLLKSTHIQPDEEEFDGLDVLDMLQSSEAVRGHDQNAAVPDMSLAQANVEQDDYKNNKNLFKLMKQIDILTNLDKDAIIEQTKERKKDIDAFSTATLSEPEKDVNTAFFEKCLKDNSLLQLSTHRRLQIHQLTEEATREGLDTAFLIQQLHEKAVQIAADNAPSHEEEALYEEALNAFAGKVLREVFQNKAFN